MRIGLISHPDCYLHEMGVSHPEQPARLAYIDKAVLNSDLNITYYEAPLAKRQHLIRAHQQEYVDLIFNITPSEGFIALDPDVLMSPYSLNAALRAAGSAIYAVELVIKQEKDLIFCNVRPPGHHAEKNKAMGFCIFNNIAVGAAHALEEFGLRRVAIIDFDVHHGNGTENIFYNDERVLYCSTFEHPFYPFSGADTRKNHIINIPLPANTSGALYREAVATKWFKSLEEFAPEMIFISAGFDAYYKDPLAHLLLKEEDYFWLSQHIKRIADKVCDGRIVSILEGGYDLEGLGSCVVAHLKGLSKPAINPSL
nr:histone deacetylase family protein [Legionella jordanis]